jgi:hypothetical protein
MPEKKMLKRMKDLLQLTVSEDCMVDWTHFCGPEVRQNMMVERV